MRTSRLITDAELAVESWATLVTAARDELSRAEARLGDAVQVLHQASLQARRSRKTLARNEERYEEAQRNLRRALELLQC
jgi:hypothetical protein